MDDDKWLVKIGTRVEPTTLDSNKKKEIMNQLIFGLDVPSGAIGCGKGGRGRCSGGGGSMVGDACNASARGRGNAGEALVELAKLGLHALDSGPAGLFRVFEGGIEDDMVAALEHPTAGDTLFLLLATDGRAEDRKIVVFKLVGVGGSEGSSSNSSSCSR
jgi:hypothetical protein